MSSAVEIVRRIVAIQSLPSTAGLLTDAVGAAAAKVRVDGPTVDDRTHTFAFGRQLDVRTIRSADFDGGQELTERAVAAYIAKRLLASNP